MATSAETDPQPLATVATVQARAGRNTTAAPAQAAPATEAGFSLAERYGQLSEEELKRLVATEAAAEVMSSAYEGVLLDEAQLEAELLATYRALRASPEQPSGAIAVVAYPVVGG